MQFNISAVPSLQEVRYYGQWCRRHGVKKHGLRLDVWRALLGDVQCFRFLACRIIHLALPFRPAPEFSSAVAAFDYVENHTDSIHIHVFTNPLCTVEFNGGPLGFFGEPLTGNEIVTRRAASPQMRPMHANPQHWQTVSHSYAQAFFWWGLLARMAGEDFGNPEWAWRLWALTNTPPAVPPAPLGWGETDFLVNAQGGAGGPSGHPMNSFLFWHSATVPFLSGLRSAECDRLP